MKKVRRIWGRKQYSLSSDFEKETKPLCDEEEEEEEASEVVDYSELEDDLENLPDHKNVVVRDHRIFLYGEITDNVARSFNVKLTELESRMIRRLSKYNIHPSASTIELHIHSGGGDSSAAFSMCNTMNRCKIPIDTYVDGECASAATFLLLLGRKRYMGRFALVLIHQLSTFFGFGTYEQLLDEKQNCDMLMKKVKGFYQKYTKVPDEELDPIMQHDIWWEADKCLKLGMIDEIL